MMDGSSTTHQSHEAALAFGLDPGMYEPQPSDRLGMPYRFPYHLGLYMAVNAIPGCFVIIRRTVNGAV